MKNLRYLERRLIYLGEYGFMDSKCILCLELVDTMLLIRSLSHPRIITHQSEYISMDVEIT